DPTLGAGAKTFYPGAARPGQLAAAATKARGGAGPTKGYYDGSPYSGPAYDPGWDWDIATGGFGGPATALTIDGARTTPTQLANGYSERFSKPDAAAALAFAKALGISGPA